MDSLDGRPMRSAAHQGAVGTDLPVLGGVIGNRGLDGIIPGRFQPVGVIQSGHDQIVSAGSAFRWYVSRVDLRYVIG